MSIKENRQSEKRQTRRKAGFTMAEMLIVVAIIGVLASVSFIAVQSHQKNLNLMELDAVAKEIYVAAQNHLFMAETENYLGSTEYGQPLDPSGNVDGIYYFAVKKGEGFSSNHNLLDQMLPFGSIDETVRAGGSYIIYYQPGSASVLDVFYTDEEYTFGANTRADFGGEDKKSSRKNNSQMLGWYGGYGNEGDTGIAEIANGSWLEQPALLVENAEKLRVTVTDPNYDVTDEGYNLILIVSGLDFSGNETGAKKAIKLRDSSGYPDSELLETPYANDGVYKIVLDDITTDEKHFADIDADTITLPFVPGQDISIQAVAYNTVLRTNIASSDVETTNSLFENISVEDGVVTASINNIRHLENLDEDISGLDRDSTIGNGTAKLNLLKSTQTSDISWTLFKGKTNGTSTVIYPTTNGMAATGADCYMPVSPGYTLSYDGQHYNVFDIKVSNAGDSGMFGALTGDTGTEVSNLALVDFSIESTDGNGGALAGSMTNMFVTNVVAYNTTPGPAATIKGSGSVGGLIGSATECTVSKSAAALVVESSGGNAGGLIGTSSKGSVKTCYSGGHTTNAAYSKSSFNVTSSAKSAYAGGLIGSAGTDNNTATAIENCYSTCSVTGANVGGLVGKASGAISKSYCTGLVKSIATTPVQGAFAGSFSGTASDCLYYEIINEIEDTTNGGFRYLTAIGGDVSDEEITPLDADATTYDSFSWPGEGADCPWKNATVYDKTLITYYGQTVDSKRTARFNLQTVEQLAGTLKTDESDTTDYFVATHYGDWPAPEIFVINTAS